MPVFAYKALDKSGKRAQGALSASSRNAAQDELARQGLFVTEIAEDANADVSVQAHAAGSTGSVSLSEMVLMLRRLATLVSAGIPLAECLKALSTQVESRSFKNIMTDIHNNVMDGQALSHAMARHPKAFSDMMVAMVRVGETGGILGQVLEDLADFAERDHEVRSEIVSAMIYPIILLLLAVGIVIFLLATAVPKMATMYVGMESALPTPTKILLGMSGFVTSHIPHCLGVVVLLVVLGVWLKNSVQGERILDQIKIHLPLFGRLVRRSSIARFARSLSALLNGGVPLMEALDVVKRVLGSYVMNEAVSRIQEHVRTGNGLARGMRDEPLFPEMVRYMISAGEESGHLDKMLEKVAGVYEMETRNTIKVLLSMLTPMMILGMAALVGFIAMAMLLPMFKMNQMIG